jgi:hypothetical protein
MRSATEDGGVAEDLGVGLEGDVGAGAFGLADDFELFDGLAALELHVVHLSRCGRPRPRTIRRRR